MRKVFGKLVFDEARTAISLRRRVAHWLMGGALLGASALGGGGALAQQSENGPSPASTWTSDNAQADAEANAKLQARAERRAQRKREQAERKKQEQERKEREDKKKAAKAEREAAAAMKKAEAQKRAPAPAAPAKPVLIATPTPKAFLPPAKAQKPVAKATSPAPLLAMGDELLYPLGMGLVLTGGLGLLGYTMRKRREEAGQASVAPFGIAEPPPAKNRATPGFSGPTIAKAVNDDRKTPDVLVELSSSHGINPPPARTIAPDEIPLPALRAARLRRARSVQVAAQSARQTPHLPESEEEQAPVPQSDHSEPPADRGVFKPLAMFSRDDEARPITRKQTVPLNPLTIGFEAVRLTLTLSRIELRFRINLRNDCPIPLHQIRVEACMGTTEGDLPETLQEHSLVGLLPGEEASISEEWRVPLSNLPVLRLGAMRLLVGTARIAAILEEDPIDQPSEMTFLIGLPEDGGRLVPIPLDGLAKVHDNLMVQSVSADQE